MRTLAGLLLLLALAGCRYRDAAFYASDGRKLDAVEPLPYRLGVAPVAELDEQAEAGTGYRFVYSSAETQERLAAYLRRFAAANEVVLVDADLAGNVDLVLRPTVVRQADFGRPRPSSKAWLSAGLWFLTWAGGLYVEDTTYDASLALDFEIVNPHDGATIDTFSAATDEMALTFRERNKGATGKAVHSMVIPPGEVGDKRLVASHALSERVLEHLAAVATGYLKQDFVEEERALLGQVKLLAPRDNDIVSGQARLSVRLSAFEPITEAAVFVNDAVEPAARWRIGEGLPDAVRQRRGSVYVADLHTRELWLPEPRNVVTFEFRVAGRPTTRTFIFRNETP